MQLEENTIETIDPKFVAEGEIDLSLVRSRITDLSMASMNIAADLLEVLAPLHRQVVDVIDLARVDEPVAPVTAQRGMFQLTA